MESRLSSSSVSLEIELTKVGEELLRRPYSTKEIIKSLVETENILSRLPQSASISMIKPLHLIIKALFAEDLVRHSNMVVKIKISVACCICEIMRIMAPDTPFNDNQMKVFFELVVTAFEKVSSSSGECHTKMIKESKELPRELVNLLAMNGKSKKEIATPVRTQLAKKVLKNYADQLNPDIPDMTVRCCLQSESEEKSLAIVETPLPSKSVTTVNGKRKKQIQSAEHGENLVGSRIKVWWPEDNTYYEGTVKSFASRSKKHKVWYDDGDKELIDLKTQKWELVEDVSPMLDCAQFAEHAENLVGSRIKVWWPADKSYYEGVMESFDRRKMKHKVLYDDGDEDVLDLNQREWVLLEDVSAIEPVPDSELALPIKFLSPQALAIKGSSTKALPKKVSSTQIPPKKGSSTQAPPEKVSSTQAPPKKVSSNEKVSSPLALPRKDSSAQALPVKDLATQTLPIKDPSTPAPLKIVSSTQAQPKKVSSTQALHKKVSTTQSGFKIVQGYKVKKSIAPTLEAIFKKHGDIASDCVFKTPSVRASILEVICEVVSGIQTNDVADTISKMEEIQCHVLAAEGNKINVSWLRQHLDSIRKRTEIKEKCCLLMKGKANISLVNKAAERDFEERRIELLTAQEQFKKAERCVEVLKLVEKKLHDNILEESKPEPDSWITQPVL
ncbi:phospholipase-like protein [Artemisia annua]|uniref:Phospholipase-like protein n=1 Tax=Artemisia annua TaxID=35608 RepID=A0A2U1N498_ARTAN|nr:phospholipase-like protein [Artemisia annua]